MNAPDLIELRGLRVTGTHGVLAEERQRAQPFEVDLDLEVDLGVAGRSDDLADTVDYGAVAEAVAAEVAGPHAALLEHLAVRVARAAVTAGASSRAGGAQVSAVTVTIRKLRPPVPLDLASAGVTVRRRREDLAIRPAAAVPTGRDAGGA